MGFFGDLFNAITEQSRWVQRAAGVSTMRLICHEDTWAALEHLPPGPATAPHRQPISATPERITERGDGMLEMAQQAETTRHWNGGRFTVNIARSLLWLDQHRADLEQALT